MRIPLLFTAGVVILIATIADRAAEAYANESPKSQTATAAKELPTPDLHLGAPNELPHGSLPGMQLPRTTNLAGPAIATPAAATYQYLGTPVAHPITPSGAAAPGLFELAAQPVLKTLDSQLQAVGLHLPVP